MKLLKHLRRLALMLTAVARGQLGDSARVRPTLERFSREGAGLGAEARYNLMSMVIDFLYQAGFKNDARANLDRELAAGHHRQSGISGISFPPPSGMWRISER
ncbi:MAG: hypothetical protein ACLQIB_06095 [Isosphaeraceae bacterium]